jgi:hypothetical protein
MCSPSQIRRDPTRGLPDMTDRRWPNDGMVNFTRVRRLNRLIVASIAGATAFAAAGLGIILTQT